MFWPFHLINTLLWKEFCLKMEQLSQNENVWKIKNEFCEIFPNQVSMGKKRLVKTLKRKFYLLNKK
jgi:proteasome assembly chaperone (PAC2) family protein